jgi:hypothetical protein
MKVLMTSGKQFNIDFETEQGYQEMREMYKHLQSKKFFKVIDSDEEKLKEMVSTLQNTFDIDKDIITMVSKHYFNQLKEKQNKGEIDEIDFAIQLGKLVVLELEERWK